MAEPDGKMFKGAKGLTKRIPKWAWYVSAGIVVAGGIYYFRSRQVVTEPVGDSYSDEGAVGYTDADQAPGIIVPAQIGGEAVPAEINTDIPISTLEIIGGMFTDALAAVTSAQPDSSELLQILAGAGSPVAGNTDAGVVTASPPPAAPKAASKPKPNPCSQLDGGSHCGSSVNMGPNAQKTFPGAIGWQRLGNGGSGKDYWIDVHVRFCDRLERWRVKPHRNNQWNKTWSGGRPNIC